MWSVVGHVGGRFAPFESTRRRPRPKIQFPMAFTQRILALLVATSVPAFAFAAPAHAAATDTKAEAASQVEIGVTIAHAGSTAKAKAVTAMDAEANISVSADDHRHDLRVTVSEVDGAEQLAVKVTYKRDGKAVVKKKSITAKSGVASIEAGGSTVTFKLSKAAPKRARIEMPDSDDPLAGVI